MRERADAKEQQNEHITDTHIYTYTHIYIYTYEHTYTL